MVKPIGGNFEPGKRRESVGFTLEGKGWHNQLYDVNSVVDRVLAEMRNGEEKVPYAVKENYIDDAKYVEGNKTWIRDHVDLRIQLFFMQLISVWRTPYHFEWIEANDQYGKGGKYRIKNEEGKTACFQTEAAHPSTLPCLMAYPKEEWEKYQKGQCPEPQGFVYLKYGHLYRQHNGTNELARFVNRADILIDGTHKNSLLRNDAIKIVNAVAEGKYSPKKGMKHFMKSFEHFVERGMELDRDDPRLLALECYLERIEEVKEEMASDEGYFDQLLGIQVAGHERESILRDVVYRKRFRLIQNCESIESQIARDILNAENQMFKTRGKSLKKTDYRLRYVLLEEIDPFFRRKLERLFCTSLAQLQAGIEKKEERLRAFEAKAKIRAFRESHVGEIRELKGELRGRFHELDNEELNYRSKLFKGLREKLNRWTQEQFSTVFRRKYPTEPMSRAMVSRMEQRTRAVHETKEYLTPIWQRRKDIHEEKAKKIADTFGVDAGLFLPAVVSSVY